MIKVRSLFRKIGLVVTIITCPAIVLAGVTKESDIFDLTVNCDGEDIHFLGTVNLQFTEVMGGDTYTGMFKAVSRAEGYGLTSGDTYMLREKFMDMVQDVAPPFVYVSNNHGHIIGHGSAPNYFFRYQIRFVVNGNGEVILDTENFVSNCGQ